MSCFLFMTDEEANNKINIDDLYDKKKGQDLEQLSIFNKILNRIHTRIRSVARNKRADKYIVYVVPDFLFGHSLYDRADCISYLVCKLEENGFFIRYNYPNQLFISWAHYVPSYVRNEYKRKTGNIMDEFGNIKIKEDEEPTSIIAETATNTAINGHKFMAASKKQKMNNIIYNDNILDNINKCL